MEYNDWIFLSVVKLLIVEKRFALGFKHLLQRGHTQALEGLHGRFHSLDGGRHLTREQQDVTFRLL